MLLSFIAITPAPEPIFITNESEHFCRSGKSFWSKYHGKLYLIYKELGLEPQPPEIGQYSCSWCGGGVLENRHHCQTCGGYPVNQENRFLFQKSYPENQYRRSQ